MQKKIKKKSIFNNFKKNIVAILAVTFVFVIITIFCSSIFMTPMYTSSAAVCLKYDMENDLNCEDPDKYVNNNIEEFLFLICTDDIKEKAEKELSKTEPKYKNVNIDNVEIEAEQFNDTNIVYIHVTSKSAQLSCDLCDVYAEISVSNASKIGNVKVSVVDNPVVSKEPSSPNVLKNCLIVALVVSIITAVFVFIKPLFMSQKVKNGKDVESKLNILFLGDIPNTSKKSNGKTVQKNDSTKVEQRRVNNEKSN